MKKLTDLLNIFRRSKKELTLKERARQLEAELIAMRNLVRERRAEVERMEREQRSKESELRHAIRMANVEEGKNA